MPAKRLSASTPPAIARGAAPWLTVAQVAGELAVSADQVRAWIGRGELAAANLATSAAGAKARWRVKRADLETFLLRRSARAPEVRPIRRRPQPTDIIRFF